jgi:hypothetical protein
MLSSASRRTDRAAAASLALLLQLGFIAAFIYAFSTQAPSPKLEHELTFFLPRLLSKPEPVPSNPAPRETAPIFIPPLLALPPVAAVPLQEAPSAQSLQSFGQALQGCAPETYSSLTPEQRAHCVRPGDGMAIQQAPNLLGTPPRAKDEAYWQEQWTEAHWTPGPCPPWEQLANCLIEQARAERRRAQAANALLATKKAEALKEPERPLPERVGVHPQ